jgi:hypothetical protein
MALATLDLDRLRTSSANDNASPTDLPPAVRAPKGRPDLVYAQQENLLLPLRFARRMAGWHRQEAN